MKIGLVGFAGSGKTTVFNTMTGLAVPLGYGGEVRLGAVRVPDERIDALSKIFSPKKTTYAEMSFCDIPGEHGAERKGLSAEGAPTDSRAGRALPRAERLRQSCGRGRSRPAA